MWFNSFLLLFIVIFCVVCSIWSFVIFSVVVKFVVIWFFFCGFLAIGYWNLYELKRGFCKCVCVPLICFRLFYRCPCVLLFFFFIQLHNFWCVDKMTIKQIGIFYCCCCCRGTLRIISFLLWNCEIGVEENTFIYCCSIFILLLLLLLLWFNSFLIFALFIHKTFSIFIRMCEFNFESVFVGLLFFLNRVQC